jgi:hypothetical protein
MDGACNTHEMNDKWLQTLKTWIEQAARLTKLRIEDNIKMNLRATKYYYIKCDSGLEYGS